MTRLAILVCLAVMPPGFATAEEAQAPKADTQECQSCNARHRALQKLQAARSQEKEVPLATLPPPAIEQEDQTVTE